MRAGARKLAKEQGLVRYFSGKPCKHGHTAERYTRNGECVECSELKWRSESRVTKAARVMKYYWNNRDRCIARSVESHRRTGFNAQRRAAKLKATPKWADLKAIRAVYAQCPVGFHVDHIIPLKGENVCGLHIVENLQILSATDNLRKGNKLLPD